MISQIEEREVSFEQIIRKRSKEIDWNLQEETKCIWQLIEIDVEQVSQVLVLALLWERLLHLLLLLTPHNLSSHLSCLVGAIVVVESKRGRRHHLVCWTVLLLQLLDAGCIHANHCRLAVLSHVLVSNGSCICRVSVRRRVTCLEVQYEIAPYRRVFNPLHV